MSIVHLSKVRKVYRSGDERLEVLRGVSLDIEAGHMVAIRGMSGSGKSTLLNLIGAIDTADEGQVEVCGVALNALNAAALTAFRRDRVGFVFQFHNLLPTLSAIENVLMAIEAQRPLKRGDFDLARQFLEAVGLGAKAHKFPHQLSGGEQQRVAIGRALVKRPPLVLADEPTGNLDDVTGAAVLDVLRRLQKESGTTIIIVTHNPALSDLADRTIFIRGGLIEEQSVPHSGEGPR